MCWSIKLWLEVESVIMGRYLICCYVICKLVFVVIVIRLDLVYFSVMSADFLVSVVYSI